MTARADLAADVVVVGAGGLGSATAWELASRGVDVILLEQFALGHDRGASHDTSRILRRSYHTPAYVRLAGEAYGDWARLEQESGQRLVTVTGGLDLFPVDAAIPAVDYTTSMRAAGVPFEELTADEVARRWPALRLPEGAVALFQADTAIVPAGRTTGVLQRLARVHGARVRDGVRVTSLVDHGAEGLEVVGAGQDGPLRVRAGRVVLTADAWTNELLAGLDTGLPLTVTREQVTYFEPADASRFGADRLPVWIWMDDPSFYGFPTYDEGGNGALVKAAQDCGGAVITASGRTFDPAPDALALLDGFVQPLLPGVGRPHHTVTCLYTLTPDRDFVLDTLPGHPAVLVGLGAGHGFKFAPTFGRLLADLATTGSTTSDVSPFAIDRPALVESRHPVSWLV